MTIAALIKKLQKAEKEIGPRARVVLDWREIRDDSKIFDHLSHWELNFFDIETIPWSIDDSTELANGSERQRTVVSLS